MVRQRQIEFASERRVGGLEQNLDIAAAEHGGDVAGAGRRAVGIGLHRLGRRREARPRQRPAGGSRVADEMPDVVEKNFAADRQLAVDFRSRSTIFSQTLLRLVAVVYRTVLLT